MSRNAKICVFQLGWEIAALFGSAAASAQKGPLLLGLSGDWVG